MDKLLLHSTDATQIARCEKMHTCRVVDVYVTIIVRAVRERDFCWITVVIWVVLVKEEMPCQGN